MSDTMIIPVPDDPDVKEWQFAQIIEDEPLKYAAFTVRIIDNEEDEG